MRKSWGFCHVVNLSSKGKVVISLPSESHMALFHFSVIMKYGEKLVSLTERLVLKTTTVLGRI